MTLPHCVRVLVSQYNIYQSDTISTLNYHLLVIKVYLPNIIDIKQQLGRFEGMLQGIAYTLKRQDNNINDIEKELRDLQK